MPFEAHGSYKIRQTGQVFRLDFAESWNLEASRKFFAEYKQVVLAAALPRFGVISDMRSFTGATPEAIAHFDEIVDWAIDHGQVARAVLLNTAFENFVLKRIVKDSQTDSSRLCTELAEAEAWLQGLGLDTGDSAHR